MQDNCFALPRGQRPNRRSEVEELRTQCFGVRWRWEGAVSPITPLAAARPTAKTTAYVVEGGGHHPGFQAVDIPAPARLFHGPSQRLLDGVFRPVKRSREQSDGAYEPHVVMLDQSIERHRKLTVSCHGFVS
jgi:hypothetical protein